jgi:bifunctional ADP-heptose synthase (sugar kinase/adenylyltransferase)
VDYVTIFDDISPRSLIARLLPDVLVRAAITDSIRFTGAKKSKLREAR